MWNDTVIELVRHTKNGAIDASSLGLGSHPTATIAERQQAISALISQLKYLSFDDRSAQVDCLRDLSEIDLPTNLMMNFDQVRELRNAGMDIGGHTVLHPILSKLPTAKARDEIIRGKASLEEIINEPVRLFAYPNGKPNSDYKAEHVAMVQELGFEGAVSTSWGAQKRIGDLFQLPRFTPWDQSRLRFALRMAKNLISPATHV